MELSRCAQHAALAGWRCTRCEQPLCPDCVAIRVVTPVEMTVCTRCGELAEPLLLDRRLIEPFWSRALQGLLFPLHGHGLATWLGLTGLLAFCWYGGLTLLALAAGVVLATLFAVARSTGRGDGQLESPGFGDLLSGAVLPVLRFALVTVPTWGGLWLAFSLRSLALGVLAIGLAFVWTPVAFLGAAAGTSFLHLLNPLAVLGTFARIGADAARLSAALLGLAGLGTVLTVAATFANALPVPVLSTVLWAALTLFTPLVAAHLCGLMLLLHPDHFGWDNLSLQPVLGDAKPRGVAPALAEERPRREHLQPIELPDAPAPHSAVPPETLRPARSELSASGLPSIQAHATDLLRHAMADGDSALALDTYRSTPGLAPLLTAAELSWVGRAAASQGADALAEQAFSQALTATGDPTTVSTAHVYLARLLADRLGRREEARALFERVVRDFPGTAAAGFAGQWLARAG